MRTRRVIRLRPAAFEEVARETDGLPPGCSLRWFRSLVARPVVVGARAGEPAPLSGAIVWSDTPDAFPEAAVAAALLELQDGPRTLAEPLGAGEGVPTVREAVAEALAAVPEALREAAGAEVEASLAAVGL